MGWIGEVTATAGNRQDEMATRRGNLLDPQFRNALTRSSAKHPALLQVAEAECMDSALAREFRSDKLCDPLESVGCYVPAGRYPLVSTVLMTVIPAQVAGVKNIRVVSPKPSAEVLAAAAMLGVTEFYRVGGAQAIAALAYGTQSIPRVDKIVGPGNAYVTAAKKLVAFRLCDRFSCRADRGVDPKRLRESGIYRCRSGGAGRTRSLTRWLSFITTKRKLANEVAKRVRQTCERNSLLPRSPCEGGAQFWSRIAESKRGWANQLSPEHITVEEKDLPFIRNAGSVFVGDYSAQAAGDYASGPNHVLPTSGQARFRGGLSVFDFVKIITVQRLLVPDCVTSLQRSNARGGRRTCRARGFHPGEVRTCLSPGRLCATVPPIIRRWQGAKDFVWILTRTRPVVRRGCWTVCVNWSAESFARYPERGPVEAQWRFPWRTAGRVVLTNGVDEAIHLLCETYLEAGDEALIVVPTYSMYRIYMMASRRPGGDCDVRRKFCVFGQGGHFAALVSTPVSSPLQIPIILRGLLLAKTNSPDRTGGAIGCCPY